MSPCGLRDARLEQARVAHDRAVVAQGVAAEAERVRVLRSELAHRRPADVHVEDPSAQVGRVQELAVGVRGLREAHELGLGALGALVDGHAPARVVVLGLADQRVLGVQQLVPDRNRLRGDAAEHAAHGATDPAATRGANSGAPRTSSRMEHRGDGTEADLVGAAGQAVRARAARGRGEEPPPRAARGRDRLPEGEGRAAVRLDDGVAAQPGRVRGGRTRVAPRAGRVGAARRGGARGAAAAAAARAAPPRGGGGARRPAHGLRGGGLRGAPARGARGGRRRRRWRARRRPGSR